MRFDVLSLFPNEFVAGLSYGVTGRALERGLIEVEATNPRDFTTDNYRRVDDKTYGGGPGMVMMLGPLQLALTAAKSKSTLNAPVILMSPQGKTLGQDKVRQLATLPRLILICGRYEGIDQRFIDHSVDEEISLGDFVLSGGEIAAQLVIDSVTRLLPGALHTAESATQDSFEQGLLDYPHYTKPEQSEFGSVPEVLRSGNHQHIANWRRLQSLKRTRDLRPDLWSKFELSKQDQRLLRESQEPSPSK